MARRNRTFWLAGALIAVLVAGSIAIAVLGGEARQEAARKMARDLPAVHLDRVPDGNWIGEAGRMPYAYAVRVTVRDHRITGVALADEEAEEELPRSRELFRRMVAQQSIAVKPLDGAEYQSVLLQIATGRALQKGEGAAARR